MLLNASTLRVNINTKITPLSPILAWPHSASCVEGLFMWTWTINIYHICIYNEMERGTVAFKGDFSTFGSTGLPIL